LSTASPALGGRRARHFELGSRPSTRYAFPPVSMDCVNHGTLSKFDTDWRGGSWSDDRRQTDMKMRRERAPRRGTTECYGEGRRPSVNRARKKTFVARKDPQPGVSPVQGEAMAKTRARPPAVDRERDHERDHQRQRQASPGKSRSVQARGPIFLAARDRRDDQVVHDLHHRTNRPPVLSARRERCPDGRPETGKPAGPRGQRAGVSRSEHERRGRIGAEDRTAGFVPSRGGAASEITEPQGPSPIPAPGQAMGMVAWKAVRVLSVRRNSGLGGASRFED